MACTLWSGIVAMVLGASSVWAAQPPANLLANSGAEDEAVVWQFGDTKEGHTFEVADGAGRAGGKAFRLSAPAGDTDLVGISQAVAVPKAHRLALSFWVRTEGFVGAACAATCVQIWSAEGEMVGFGTTQGSEPVRRDQGDWSRSQTELVTTTDAARANVIPFVFGGGTAWFDDITLDDMGPGVPPEPPLKGPAVVLARGAYDFRATEDSAGFTVTSPIPVALPGQMPFWLGWSCDPPRALVSARVVARDDVNHVLELTLAPLKKGENARVTVEAAALLDKVAYSLEGQDFPNREAVAADVAPWLASTRCVQCDDARVREMADKGRAEAGSFDAFIRWAATAPQRAKGDHIMSLDAASALSGPGSCTSNANLVAALLRAEGIPARILAGYPTWCGPLQTHYIVEYWTPAGGWTAVESSRGEVPTQPFKQIEVSLVTPDDENRSFRSETGVGLMAADGVPYGSLLEGVLPSGVLPVGIVKEDAFCDHEAKELLRFDPEKDAAVLDELRRKLPHTWSIYLIAPSQGGANVEADAEYVRALHAHTAEEFLEAINRAGSHLPWD
jgi:transglutaminase-like putative cysteine protease